MQGQSKEQSDLSAPDTGMGPAEIRWHFGSFIVWEVQRRLERSGQPVRLGPRAFDLLLQLLKRAGELVGKEELLSAVWADVVVEEASVRVHMSLLRKVLGEPGESDDCKEWISNVPLRGYQFNGRVLREVIDAPAWNRARVSPPLAKLPVRLTELVGREEDVEGILRSLDNHRLVTIVGPGGIGKTSAAIRAAERLQSQLSSEIAFADLSPLISPDHVLGTMARSLGVAADLPEPVQAITQSLSGRNVLLLLDNCEHVVESLALPIMRLLTASPGLRVLATSRQTLHVSGEYVLRLPPLGFPAEEHFTLEEALRSPSVELLVARAKAAGAGLFNHSDGPSLARVARQLEGIPLAIELVAARLGVQSIGDLAPRLEDHLRLLAIGNRGAPARHRTLAAALDWSIALLSEEELRVFRRLSVFRGRFDVDSAVRVTASDMETEQAYDALISLADKSLVFFDGNDAFAPYRLLDTTRSYAAALLEQSDERPAILQRHATLMHDLMTVATAELPTLAELEWAERYAHYLDDVRFALDACLTGHLDAKVAAAMVRASAPLWFQVSQVAEYRDRVAAVLRLVEQQQEPNTESATWLINALIIALLHTDGSNPDLNPLCDRALAGALAAGIRELELQARWGRCTHDIFRGEYTAALQHSEKILAAAESWSDPAALNLAYRVRAMASHFCGRFDAAESHCYAALRVGGNLGRVRSKIVGVDPDVATKALLSRTLWIRGETAQALTTAKEAVSHAESLEHTVSLCAALYGACPVALWSGEIELASTWINLMLNESRRRGLVGWLRYAEWYFQGLQLSISKNPDCHIREVAERLSTYDAPRKEMLLSFCPDWMDDTVPARISKGEGLWIEAEAWRAAGRRSEKHGERAAAEKFYLRAIDTSRRQNAKAWERRAALSLARLWTRWDKPRQALDLLDLTYGASPLANDASDSAHILQLREEIAHILTLDDSRR
jgi:predicted ATPase/DNA-binding winged helix-turn-helix (wHTH) protein